MIPLTDAELAELKAEHVLEEWDDRTKCAAFSDDACAWSEEWPCRTARLVAEVGELRAALTSGSVYLPDE